jgi:ligand-binding sensor domain-containing protein
MMRAPGASVWEEKTNGLPQASTFDLSNPPEARLVADREENLYFGMSQGLFRSTNRGNNWQRVGLSIADTTITALAISPAGTIFAATELSGIYSSSDNGDTWQHLTDAPGLTGFQMLAVDSSNALIAGNIQTGLYRSSSTSSVPAGGSRPAAGLALYPNPAGQHAIVEFDMKSAGDARLVLYSSTGRQLAVIAEGELSFGNHRFTVDMSGYTPGVYLLQLETGRGSERVGVVVAR